MLLNVRCETDKNVGLFKITHDIHGSVNGPTHTFSDRVRNSATESVGKGKTRKQGNKRPRAETSATSPSSFNTPPILVEEGAFR